MFAKAKGNVDSRKNRRLRNLLIKKEKKKNKITQEQKLTEKEDIAKKRKTLEILQALKINANKNIIIEKKNSKKRIKDDTKPKNQQNSIKTNPNSQNVVSIKQEEKLNDTNIKISKEAKIQTIISPTFKSSQENTQSNISDTQEKNLLKLAIANEIEVILKEKQYDLNKLIVDFNVINQHIDEKLETSDLEKMSEEINHLITKLETIKRELELLTNSATFKNIYQLHEPYLTNIIDEYRETLNQNKEMLDTVIRVENDVLYVSIIDKIKELEVEKDKLAKKVKDTIEKYAIRDKEFEKWKSDYIDIEKIGKSLDEIVEISNCKLKEIEKKINKSVTVTEIVETKMKSSLDILTKTLLLIYLLKKNPTRQANAITAVTTITALSLINDLAKPKKIVTKRIETDLIDYKHIISDTINDVEQIDILINNSLENIKNLKDMFEKEFKQYQYDLPEYKEFFDKLNIVELEMLDRKHDINKISQELDYQYDKNNEKVKKYSNLN